MENKTKAAKMKICSEVYEITYLIVKLLTDAQSHLQKIKIPKV